MRVSTAESEVERPLAVYLPSPPTRAYRVTRRSLVRRWNTGVDGMLKAATSMAIPSRQVFQKGQLHSQGSEPVLPAFEPAGGTQSTGMTLTVLDACPHGPKRSGQYRCAVCGRLACRLTRCLRHGRQDCAECHGALATPHYPGDERSELLAEGARWELRSQIDGFKRGDARITRALMHLAMCWILFIVWLAWWRPVASKAGLVSQDVI